MTTYEERCKQAATDQGLDEPFRILQEADPPFKPEILQTGGFTMLIEAVNNAESEEAQADPNQIVKVWVTYQPLTDAENDPYPYLVGRYIGPEEEENGYTYVSAEDLAEMCRIYESWESKGEGQ